MFATLWTWFTAKESRTWLAHGLVAATGALVGGALGWVILDRGTLTQALAGTAGLLYFLYREMADEIKHKEDDNWTPKKIEDQVGDLVGPIFVCISSWLGVLWI